MLGEEFGVVNLGKTRSVERDGDGVIDEVLGGEGVDLSEKGREGLDVNENVKRGCGKISEMRIY